MRNSDIDGVFGMGVAFGILVVCASLTFRDCKLKSREAVSETAELAQEVLAAAPISERVVKMNVAGTDEYQWEWSVLFDNYDDLCRFRAQKGFDEEIE